MAFLPISGGIMVRVHGTNNTGQDVINVLHFRGTTPNPTQAEVIAAAQFYVTTVFPLLRQGLSTAYTLLDVTARDISVLNGYEFTQFVATNNTGLVGGEPDAANVAISQSWRTTRAGRSERGRSYWGILSEGSTTGDRINPTLVNTLITVGTAIIAQAPSVGLTFGIKSIADAVFKVVTAYVLETIVDSQQRRLTTRGR